MKSTIFIATTICLILFSIFSGCDICKGSIVFSIQWPSLVTSYDVNCDVPDISSVDYIIYKRNGKVLINGSLSDSMCEGSISEVSSKSDLKLVVYGKDSQENILYRGEHSGFTVQPGKETVVETITAYGFVPQILYPLNESELSIRFRGIQWDCVQDVIEYQIIISENNDLSSPVIDNTTNECFFNPHGLSYETTYYFGIRAIDTNGYYSNSSDIRSFYNSRLRWKTDIHTHSYAFSSPAIDAQGTVYIGSSDDNLYAINNNGTVKWTFATEDMITASPAIGMDNTVYIGSRDGNLYSIDTDNGTKKWAFDTQDLVLTSPAIGLDGTIYTISNSGNFFIFTVERTVIIKTRSFQDKSINDFARRAVGLYFPASHRKI